MGNIFTKLMVFNCLWIILSLASCSSYSSKERLTAEAVSQDSLHQDELEESQVDSEHIPGRRGQEFFPINIDVDVSRPIGRFRRIWRFFGADESNYAYMENGEKLIKELGELAPREVYFRAHNLLTSGDGTPALKWGSTGVYREDANGNPVYDWTILDRIFDTYLMHGVRPYVEIGFMPKDLSIKPEPYQHKWNPDLKYKEVFTGWAYPPKDYDKWGELVYQWVRRCVDRYGASEVKSWYWQTWNEANIAYWQGTPEEFYKLHDYAIDAVRRALPEARVGGPDTAGPGGQFMRDFLEHCLRGINYANGKKGTPLDFVSFHAKDSPKYVDGHVQMGMDNQLRAIDRGFEIIASYPELEGIPIIIGESDPEGCAACQGEHLGYRNGTMYSSYTAASFARKMDLADKHDVNLQGALTWAFEFEDQPYFAGFRSLATNGIDKPVLNVFRMYGKMSGQRLSVNSSGAVPLDTILKEGVREKPDVSALATLDKNKVCVMLWHYHDEDIPGPQADVKLTLSGLPIRSGTLQIRHYRIDQEHSNAYTLWKKMGSPQQPTAQQYAQLEKAGHLTQIGRGQSCRVDNHQVILELDIPRQAVSLLVFEWSSRNN
ncbi:MAG: beta-xylosidase [Planctomycetota bacterium]